MMKILIISSLFLLLCVFASTLDDGFPDDETKFQDKFKEIIQAFDDIAVPFTGIIVSCDDIRDGTNIIYILGEYSMKKLLNLESLICKDPPLEAQLKELKTLIENGFIEELKLLSQATTCDESLLNTSMESLKMKLKDIRLGFEKRYSDLWSKKFPTENQPTITPLAEYELRNFPVLAESSLTSAKKWLEEKVGPHIAHFAQIQMKWLETVKCKKPGFTEVPILDYYERAAKALSKTFVALKKKEWYTGAVESFFTRDFYPNIQNLREKEDCENEIEEVITGEKKKLGEDYDKARLGLELFFSSTAIEIGITLQDKNISLESIGDFDMENYTKIPGIGLPPTGKRAEEPQKQQDRSTNEDPEDSEDPLVIDQKSDVKIVKLCAYLLKNLESVFVESLKSNTVNQKEVWKQFYDNFMVMKEAVENFSRLEQNHSLTFATDNFFAGFTAFNSSLIENRTTNDDWGKLQKDIDDFIIIVRATYERYKMESVPDNNEEIEQVVLPDNFSTESISAFLIFVQEKIGDLPPNAPANSKPVEEALIECKCMLKACEPKKDLPLVEEFIKKIENCQEKLKQFKKKPNAAKLKDNIRDLIHVQRSAPRKTGNSGLQIACIVIPIISVVIICILGFLVFKNIRKRKRENSVLLNAESSDPTLNFGLNMDYDRRGGNDNPEDGQYDSGACNISEQDKLTQEINGSSGEPNMIMNEALGPYSQPQPYQGQAPPALNGQPQGNIQTQPNFQMNQAQGQQMASQGNFPYGPGFSPGFQPQFGQPGFSGIAPIPFNPQQQQQFNSQQQQQFNPQQQQFNPQQQQQFNPQQQQQFNPQQQQQFNPQQQQFNPQQQQQFNPQQQQFNPQQQQFNPQQQQQFNPQQQPNPK